MDEASEGENKEVGGKYGSIGGSSTANKTDANRKDNTALQKPRKGRGRKLEETGLKKKFINY